MTSMLSIESWSDLFRLASGRGRETTWRRLYADYLLSDEWRAKRRQVILRDDRTCRHCGDGAEEVHHLTYEHIGDERLDELLSLCRPCHEGVTAGAIHLPQKPSRVRRRLTGAPIEVVPTGFSIYDCQFKGLPKGGLTVLASHVSVGKSALALNIARRVAEDVAPVLWMDYELSTMEVLHRLISAESGVECMRLASGAVGDEEYARVKAAVDALKKVRLYIDTRNGRTVQELASAARGIIDRQAVGLVVIDCAGLILSSKDRGRRADAGEIGEHLANLADEKHVAVLLLSHLEHSYRPDSIRPEMLDLARRCDLAPYTDVVMFLHREDQINPNTDQRNTADLIVAKNRHGRTGAVSLRWYGSEVRFADRAYYQMKES